MAWTYLDTETDPITPGRLAPRMVCLQIAEDGGEVDIHLSTDPATRAVAEKALRSFRICGHNIAYDMAVLAERCPDLLPLIWAAYDEGRVYDTLLAAQLQDVAAGRLSRVKGWYSLAKICERNPRIGLNLDKGADSWQMRYGELFGVAVKDWPAGAKHYAKLDIEATRAVVREQIYSANVEIGGFWPTFDVQVRAAFALHLASCWGMRCDEAAVAALEDRLNRVLHEKREKLQESGVLRENGSLDMAHVRALAAQAGVKKKTATGQISVSAAALQDAVSPELADLQARQKASKVVSTYLPVLKRGVVEPVHTRYGLVESGRTSSSGPNIQNLPRDSGVRECFVPRPGFVFVSADFHVVELVCLSQVLITMYGLEACAMPKALIDGKDLHLVTAGHILNWSYERTVERYKAGDPDAKNARQLAKGLNFGIPGGLGPDKLRQLLRGYGHEVTREQAVRLKDQWLHLYPEMRLFFQAIAAATRLDDGEGVRDKHAITGFLRGGLDYCSLANHQFQHLAAYGAKLALYAVQRACFTPGTPLYGSRMVFFVHDEIGCEVPEALVDGAARELVAIMCGEFAQACPDVPVRAEAVAMRRWCKDAKPKHDLQGRLIPWE